MASLDMTLDDMIKSRRNSEKGGRGQDRSRRGRGAGGSFRGGRTTGAPPRKGQLGVTTRPSANRIAKASSKLSGSFAFPRQFDML